MEYQKNNKKKLFRYSYKEIPKERYISLKKGQKIIDNLRSIIIA